MLIIRREQMEAFQRSSRKPFTRRLMAHLREARYVPVEACPDSILERQVEERIERGLRHGLTSDLALACFVTMTFIVAEDFDEHPSIKPWLRATRLPPAMRIRALIRFIPEQEWRALMRGGRKPGVAQRGPDHE
jgi:hypothetical protein